MKPLKVVITNHPEIKQKSSAANNLKMKLLVLEKFPFSREIYVPEQEDFVGSSR